MEEYGYTPAQGGYYDTKLANSMSERQTRVATGKKIRGIKKMVGQVLWIPN